MGGGGGAGVFDCTLPFYVLNLDSYMKLPLQKLLQIIPRPNINHPNGRQEPPYPLKIHLQCKRTGQS